MYQKVNTDLNFVDREKEVEKFWRDNGIFKKTLKQREGGETYTFYDGPPTANGKPHIGHVLTRVIKDMIPRYHTMKGAYVPRKAGWDTHGLPVELEVEKKLGLNGKEQIEEYGMEPFIKECKESVWKYKGMWEDFSGTVGFWADMDDPYITYEDDYIESEWWALKEIWDKGLLYKGFKVVPYCPRCGTPLSAQEVAQGYKTLKERSAIVKFKVKGEDAYFLAWTTTPWTLPSNVGLCVNPNEAYVKVEAVDGNVYYLAEELADTVLGGLANKVNAGQSATENGQKAGENAVASQKENNAKQAEKSKTEKETGQTGSDGAQEQNTYKVLERFTGKDLEYKEYEPLYDCAKTAADRQHKKGFFVVCDNYVTMSDGTGIVHIVPAFGEDDANVGREYDLPLVQMVNEKGEMLDETPFAGMRAKPTEEEMKQGKKSADPAILEDLKERGLLFAAPKFEHDYPHCWRCDTPLLYYARESWFIKMTAVRDNLIKNNNTVNWIPESIGKGRFGDWLENVQDWGISRNRYWGTPLNIWECEGCGHQMSIGSRKELAEKSGNDAALTVELHRPYIDEITCACPKCGKTMKRVPEVIDCWFDSGAMPFAQYHYPFENQELFDKQFPAQFISEAVDQTRGWFYSLMAESTLLFDKSPYENVIVMGHVQDEHGQKMSKSKGNAVDPFDALSTYGADAIRWYFYINSAPWLPNRFSGKAVQEGQRKFLGTLWNTYAFFVLYANIDNFDATKYTLEYDKLSIMDKWILSRLHSTICTVDDDLAHYRIPETARALDGFVDDLSNWYVRRSRERFWAKGMEQDKVNAYMTLYTCLVDLCKIAAPMIPFMTEEIYQNLVVGIDKSAPESIHLCLFPEVRAEWIDEELENNMKELLKIVVFGRACRNASGIKNRQPIAKMFIKAGKELPDYFTDIISDELNVKAVAFAEDVSDYTTYEIKPNLPTVGPKYGKYLRGIQEVLKEIDGNKAVAMVKSDGALTLPLHDGTVGNPFADGASGNEEIRLTEEDLLITQIQKDGYVTDGDNEVTVVLDINLTDELIEEGFAREIVSKVQTMRKEAGFEVTDHIRLGYEGSDRIVGIFGKWKDVIANDVLAETVAEGENGGYSKEWNINGEEVQLYVQRCEDL